MATYTATNIAIELATEPKTGQAGIQDGFAMANGLDSDRTAIVLCLGASDSPTPLTIQFGQRWPLGVPKIG